MKTTIYILATDGRDGTQVHAFTNEKEAFEHLADFHLCETSASEAKGIYAHHGWNEEITRLFNDEELRADPMNTYAWDEFPIENKRHEPLLDAARNVVDCWEDGNLAAAVNELGLIVRSLDEEATLA